MRAQATVWSVVLVGVVLRVALACVNDPGNAYDDHIQGAAHYASLLAERADPWQCWECYQPSLYYRLASAGARLFELIGLSQPWKAAQLLSASMSSLALVAGTLTVVSASGGSRHAELTGTAFLALLPRSLYSFGKRGVMVGDFSVWELSPH